MKSSRKPLQIKLIKFAHFFIPFQLSLWNVTYPSLHKQMGIEHEWHACLSISINHESIKLSALNCHPSSSQKIQYSSCFEIKHHPSVWTTFAISIMRFMQLLRLYRRYGGDCGKLRVAQTAENRQRH